MMVGEKGVVAGEVARGDRRANTCGLQPGYVPRRPTRTADMEKRIELERRGRSPAKVGGRPWRRRRDPIGGDTKVVNVK